MKAFDKAIETEFGLKVKSVSVVKGNAGRPEDATVKVLFEFTKDVDEKIRRKIASTLSGSGNPDEFKKPLDERELTGVELVFFDDENVRIEHKFPPGISSASVDGPISGKKGEAFRVLVPVAFLRGTDKMLAQTNRTELRLKLPREKGAEKKIDENPPKR